MSNKYCNLSGGEKISETFGQINDGFASVETDKDELQSQINNHIDSNSAHNAENITFESERPTLIDIDDTKEAIEKIDQRVDELVNNPDPNKDLELVDLRNSNIYGVFPTAKARLDHTDNLFSSQLADNATSVKSFGAKGDGVTDDTIKIQECFDYVNSLGGGKVLFPDGTYLISAGLIFYSNMEIVGTNATIKVVGKTYNKSINIFSSTTFEGGSYDSLIPIVENVTFNGIKIDGNINNVTTSFSFTGINAYKVKNFKVINSTIKNLAGTIGGGYGIITWYSENVTIRDIVVDRTDRQNICIWETKNALIENANLNFSYLRDCLLVSGNVPVSLQASDCTIRNSKLKNVASTGTHVVRYSGYSSGIVENCEIESANNGEGIYYVCADNIDVKAINNTIINCLYGILAENNGVGQIFDIVNNTVKNCDTGIKFNLQAETANVINNKIIGTIGQPLSIGYVKNVNVKQNTINGGSIAVGLTPIETMNVEGNRITGITSASYALLCSGTPTQIPVFTNNQSYGNTQNDYRILTDAKCVGNIGNINSTTVTFEDLNKYRKVYRTSAPTTGTWALGDICENVAPTAVKNISHWKCIVGGTTGGTWLAYGCGSGTTDQRPTLTINDKGYLYRDTDTGTIVFWNGSAWI